MSLSMMEPFDLDTLDFLSCSGLHYIVPVVYEAEDQWMLCDEDGDPVLISSLEMIWAIAREAGIELCNRH